MNEQQLRAGTTSPQHSTHGTFSSSRREPHWTMCTQPQCEGSASLGKTLPWGCTDVDQLRVWWHVKFHPKQP